MKNLKVRVKLIVSFLILLALAIVVGAVGIFSITSAAAETALLSDRTHIAILSARLNRNVQAQRASFRGAAIYHVMMNMERAEGNAELAAGHETMRENDLNTVQTLSTDFHTAYEEIGPLLRTEEGRQLYAAIGAAITPFEAARDTYLASITDPSKSDEEMVADLNKVAETVAPLGSSVAALVDYMDQLTTEQAASAAATSFTTTIIMVAILAVVAIIAVILAMYISGLISKPLVTLTAFMHKAGGTGDITLSQEDKQVIDKLGKVKDEIGQVISNTGSFVAHVTNISNILTNVSNGDLTDSVNLLSDKDTMGIALKNMSDNLNYMFGEINSVAQQVTTASTEIAQGAQSLAQGSTEQASTVQEISASINEITEQSSVSVQTANDSARESQTIRGIAQDGSEKMDRLAEAVQEMSDATQSIGNVIKAIEDIAFQTNILALNASVEAARAGEHGKGFAVVADEVRNLAGKSADAAKETATLITASIAKSELGLTISRETAETLQKIVQGVESTTDSLGTIAQQSEAAKAATEQVNMAVDQVAQVVQQNSATSEESAAASEEMSSQAQVLQQLISRFKLKETDQGGLRQRLPAPAARTEVITADSGGSVIF